MKLRPRPRHHCWRWWADRAKRSTGCGWSPAIHRQVQKSNLKFSHPIVSPSRWWLFAGLTELALFWFCGFWHCRLCPRLADIKTEKDAPQKRILSMYMPRLRPGLHWGLLRDRGTLGRAKLQLLGCSLYWPLSCSHGSCLWLPVPHSFSVCCFYVPDCIQVEPQFLVVLLDLLGSHWVVCRSLARVWLRTHTFRRGVFSLRHEGVFETC